MKHIEARVSRNAALAHFRRRRFRNLYGLLLPRPSVTPSGATLPALERVWLPFYLIDVHVSSRRGPGTMSVSVEGYSGAFAVFERHDNLVDGDIADECFPPRLSPEQAVEIGRQQLLQSILRRRSQQVKPSMGDTLRVSVFYHPFWVYYFQRRGGRLDFRVQDALTGEKAGNRNRSGLLDAFVAQEEGATGAASDR